MDIQDKEKKAKAHLINIALYTDDPLGTYMVDNKKLRLTAKEIQRVQEDIIESNKAYVWMMDHPQGRQRSTTTDKVNIRDLGKPRPYLVHIGYKKLANGKKHVYKTDREALGANYDRWKGWTIDINNARAWTTRGKEASYTNINKKKPSKGYINVNSWGLHRVVMMAYLVLRARTSKASLKTSKEFNSGTKRKKSPCQVHHKLPKLKGKRFANSLGYISLERVEKNRPNYHQIYSNIERKIRKYQKKTKAK